MGFASEDEFVEKERVKADGFDEANLEGAVDCRGVMGHFCLAVASAGTKHR